MPDAAGPVPEPDPAFHESPPAGAAAVALGPWPGSATEPPPWARLEALNARLLRHASATLALERWCRAHGAADATIVARQMPGAGDEAPATAKRRHRLGVGPDEPLRHRRVRLSCGGRALSDADNWYVPSRLTPEMRLLLDRTDLPFGLVVAGLRFRRLVLAVEHLWPAREGVPAPRRVLRHRALLVAADGMPLAEVAETYLREALFLAGASSS